MTECNHRGAYSFTFERPSIDISLLRINTVCGLANDILEGLIQLGHPVDEVIVFQLKADGSVDSPGRRDSLLLLDVLQLAERGSGEVLEEGVPHTGLLRDAPGVAGRGSSSSVRLPGGEFFAVTKDQISPIS